MVDQFKPAGPPPPPPAHLKHQWPTTWSVIYDRDLGAGMGAHMQVTIREKRDFASLRLTGNLPSRPEIGFFRTVLPDAEVDRLRALVRASDYLKYGHRGAMRPDTPVTTLRENDDVSTFIPDSLPPASVTAVFHALDQTAEEIIKHPFKTLRGEARWAAAQVKRGEHVDVSVALRSVGSELIIIDDPLGSPSTTWVGLRLTVAKDKPDAELDWEKDVKQFDLIPQNLLTAEGKLAKGHPPRIELAPGAELRFLARRKLLLSEGHYKGTLTFIGGGEPRDGRVVEGSLAMALGPITVKH